MSVTITFVAVVAFSFVAGEALQRLANWRGVILSGAEYALIGVLVGPLALGLLTADVLAVMEPAAWLLVGIVGFTMGLRLRTLRDTRLLHALAGLLMALFTMAGIAAAGAGVLVYAGTSIDPAEMLLPVVSLGAAGAVFSSRLHRQAVDQLGASGPMVEILTSATVVGSTLAVVVAGLTMDWQRAIESPALYNSLQLPPQVWLAMGVLLGIACGVLFILFHRGEHDEERTFLAIIGVVIFASGIAAALGSSPLLVGLVAGLTVSTVSNQADELLEQLHVLDRPLSIVLMLFAGALFVPLEGVFWLLPLAYVASRTLSLVVWPRLFLGPLLNNLHKLRIADGMRSQGVVPMAIGVSLSLAHPEMAPITDAILIGVLAFEPGAGRALRRLLGDAGELGRVPAADGSEAAA